MFLKLASVILSHVDRYLGFKRGRNIITLLVYDIQRASRLRGIVTRQKQSSFCSLQTSSLLQQLSCEIEIEDTS